jgi:hypothetical protein
MKNSLLGTQTPGKYPEVYLTFSTFFLLNAAAAVESETFVVGDARTE